MIVEHYDVDTNSLSILEGEHEFWIERVVELTSEIDRMPRTKERQQLHLQLDRAKMMANRTRS